jgi:hypothetical protein
LFELQPGSLSGDCGEVDVGVVDAIEDVGESVRRKGEADLHQLCIAVAGGFDRSEIVIR